MAVGGIYIKLPKVHLKLQRADKRTIGGENQHKITPPGNRSPK